MKGSAKRQKIFVGLQSTISSSSCFCSSDTSSRIRSGLRKSLKGWQALSICTSKTSPITAATFISKSYSQVSLSTIGPQVWQHTKGASQVIMSSISMTFLRCSEIYITCDLQSAICTIFVSSILWSLGSYGASAAGGALAAALALGGIVIPL